MKDVSYKHRDRRIMDRNFGKGLVKEAELQAFLKALPDEASNAQWVQMDLHDAEISEGSGDSSEGSAEGGRLKNEGIPMVREGIPFLLICLIAMLGCFTVAGLWPVGIVFGLLAVYVVFFFRNPERLAPIGSALVASPADGRVLYAGVAKESEFLNQETQKISIFMSLWDVHVNRVPIDGTVRDMKYHRGRFMAAFEDRASEENERNALLMETSKGEKLVLVQVAGLVARRIICYPTVGAFILKGQRIGLIRFGSRCDIYLPKSAEILVKNGEKVLGGETIIAKLKESPAASA